MQTIQSQITNRYGIKTWLKIRDQIQEIAAGSLTIADVEAATNLTTFQARTITEIVRSFIEVPNNKIFNKSNSRCQKWLILPDVHRPFHNKVLWAKILQLIYDMGSDLYGIIFNGDYLDAYTIGIYNAGSVKNLTGRTLGMEYEEGSRGLDEIDEARVDGTKLVFMFGNHEDRFKRLVERGDNAKYGSALKSPVEGLSLIERGYDVYNHYGEDFYILGNHLEVIHGDYATKYAAEKHLRLGGGSYVLGHCHLIQSYHSGESAAFAIGWLGDKNNPVFAYAGRLARKKWANGFALVNIDDNGFYYVNQVTVWNDSFYVNDKRY